MRLKLILSVIIAHVLLFSFFCIIYVHTNEFCDSKSNDEDGCASKSNNLYEEHVQNAKEKEEIHLVVVACGDRLNETLVMIKSAVFLTQGSNPIVVHIFAEDDLHEEFTRKLAKLDESSKWKFDFKIYPITYTRGNPEKWRKVFKPCATQRLFLPEALPNVEKILYVDTDILFFTPIEEVWNHFNHFNSTHIAALAPEHESANAGWYNRFARHPYYPPLGVNSGVMLMHLKKMRDVNWIDHHLEYFKEYEKKITWGDQDLINIFFHYYPEKLYIYPCQWNYRPDHCMYGQMCKTAVTDGVRIIHGSRSYFHLDKQPVFKAIYQTMLSIPIDSGLKQLVVELDSNLNKEVCRKTICGLASQDLTRGLKTLIKSLGL